LLAHQIPNAENHQRAEIIVDSSQVFDHTRAPMISAKINYYVEHRTRLLRAGAKKISRKDKKIKSYVKRRNARNKNVRALWWKIPTIEARPFLTPRILDTHTRVVQGQKPPRRFLSWIVRGGSITSVVCRVAGKHSATYIDDVGHRDQRTIQGPWTPGASEESNRVMAYNWRDVLPIHPAADSFPLMSESKRLTRWGAQ
jgi:hypothetical protein